jgi:hypothetical protein
VTTPEALDRAQALDGWCQRYGVLPWPGSLMEQPAVAFLRWQALLGLAGQQAAQEPDPLAGIRMVAL